MNSTISTRTVQLYRAAIIGLLIIVATLGALTGVLLTHHDTPAPATSSSSVSSFNDGFSDSKADDCQQGFAAACAWLKAN